MEFQIRPRAKQLILNNGCQVIVNIEKKECWDCDGHIVVPFLSAQLGRPKDSQLDEYEILYINDINIYVHNVFHKFETSVTLAIDLSISLNEKLVMYGVIPDN